MLRPPPPQVRQALSEATVYAYRLQLSYDGRGYRGFQSQPCGHTIQDIVEAALMQVAYLQGRFMGASRTDAGVSAAEQVGLFRSSRPLQVGAVLRSLNQLLPPQIRVHDLQLADTNFHPLTASIGKIYRYRLYCGKYCSAQHHDLYWPVTAPLDIGVLHHELCALIGVHDFKAFAKQPAADQSTVRELVEIQVYAHGAVVELWFHGVGFLRHMIRNIVGSGVALATGTQVPSRGTHLVDIMATYDRTQAYQTAPAPPLRLMACLFAGDTRRIQHCRQPPKSEGPQEIRLSK